MELSIRTSKKCPEHQVRISKKLMTKFCLDLGDWLVFDIDGDYHSVMVVSASLHDIIIYGHDYAVVSENSPIASKVKADVAIEPHKLTIGADPEFFVINRHTKRLREAYKILPFNGKVGCDGELAELRPDYALDPEQLVSNIAKLIRVAKTKIREPLLPYSASFYQRRCCGFHIHLGMPQEVLAFAADKTDLFLKNLVTALDYYVGVPAAAVDPDNNRRFSGNYGKPSDFRLSMRTLEYRTPGGYHLCSPERTRQLVTSAFIITEKIVKEIEESSDSWINMHHITDTSYFRNRYNVPTKERVQQLLYNRNKKLLLAETEKINRLLREYSEEYSSSIVDEPRRTYDPFFEEWSKYEKERQTHLYSTCG